MYIYPPPKWDQHGINTCYTPMISSMGFPWGIWGLNCLKSRHGHQLGRCQEPVPQVEQPQGPGALDGVGKSCLRGETSIWDQRLG